MKRKMLAGLATGVFMLGMGGVAGATLITDKYDPTPDPTIDNKSKILFSHDITDNGFNSGVVGEPGVDTITSAILDIYTYDDENDNPSEKYKLTIDVLPAFVNIDVVNKSSSPTAWEYIFTLLTVTVLQSDGKLDVTIDGQAGDFKFDRSELTAEWTEYVAPPSPVPEPATMLLMGTGLAGLVAAQRRKVKKN